MKCIMNSGGFSVQDSLNYTSKKKLFKVTGSYEAEYEVSGQLDRKLNKDTYERYITIAMREMASKWLKYESKVTAPLFKLIDDEEKEMEDLGKKLHQSALGPEQEKRQKKLQAEADKLISNVLSPALTAAAAESHEVAFKTLSAEAKSVLTSKKQIAFKVGGVAFKVSFGVTASVLTGMAVGSVAAGPVGLVIGGSAAVGMAILALSVKGIQMLVGLAKQSKSVHSEFKGNLKAYNASVDKLRSQLDESIKLSRALTAKWDLVCLRHADILAQLDELDSPLSKIADADAKAAKIADLRKKLEDEGRKMAKFIAYDPAGVEEAFQKARMEIINHCAPDVFEKRLGQVEDFVGRVDNLVGAAGTVLGGLAK